MKPIKSLDKSMLGFTLIETLLALTMFALIIAMAYQSIIATATGRTVIVEEVSRQHSLQTGHLALKNAFSSRGKIKGNNKIIEIDLASADNPWLAGTQSIVLSLNTEGQLRAMLDDALDSSLLIDKLDRAEFKFHHKGVDHSQWMNGTLPDWVELSWVENGEIQRWRFACR